MTTGADPRISQGGGGGVEHYRSIVWKASDGPVPLALALKGSGAMLLRFFPLKRHLQNS